MPSLDEINELVHTSSSDDWRVIRSPIYEHKVERIDSYLESGEVEHWIEIGEHDVLAVYRPDVSLRIAFGIATRDARDWTPEWAHFADPEVNAVYADVFWNGALIDRNVVIEVDGGRALLPDPREFRVRMSDDVFDSEVVGHTVSGSQVAFARLLHSFSQREDFDQHLEWAEFVVVPG